MDLLARRPGHQPPATGGCWQTCWQTLAAARKFLPPQAVYLHVYNQRGCWQTCWQQVGVTYLHVKDDLYHRIFNLYLAPSTCRGDYVPHRPIGRTGERPPTHPGDATTFSRALGGHRDSGD